MVTVGQTATFSVVAAGTAPLSYRWMKSGTTIPGATATSYTTPPTASADNGSQFTVVVSNTAGKRGQQCSHAQSQCRCSGAYDHHQPASQTVTVGQTATFSVVAAGTTPLSYRWMKGGAAISGGTSSIYATPPATSADNGSQFTVMVSNIAGSVTSNAATLTVSAAAVAPSITTQPASQTVTVRADSHVQRGSGGYRTVELPVDEERHDHSGSDGHELHDPAHHLSG